MSRGLDLDFPGEGKANVFVIAEFEPLRLGIESAVLRSPDLHVCGSAGSVYEAAGAAALGEADVILVDVDALRVDPRQFSCLLGERLATLRVLFLGEPQDAAGLQLELLQALLKLDTIGFILKSGPANRLVDALKLVSRRGFVCETEIIKNVLSHLSRWASNGNGDALENLSERELEVLKLVAQGKSNKEIARELFVSEGTVKAHISHIMSKMNVERRTELVKQALIGGLVSTIEEE